MCVMHGDVKGLAQGCRVVAGDWQSDTVPCLPHLYSTAQSLWLLPLDTPDPVSPEASVTHSKDVWCEHFHKPNCTPAQLPLSSTPCAQHSFYEFLSYQ